MESGDCDFSDGWSIPDDCSEGPTLLENWSVQAGLRDGYTAPEAIYQYLVGDSSSHDWKTVITSPIVRYQGRFVWTRSGTCYQLGEIDPDYARFLASVGYPEGRMGGVH